MIKKIFGSLAVTAFFAAPLFVACSSSSSGVSSGVDGTKKGSEVTDAETVEVCQAIVDYAADTIDPAATCKSAGYAAAFGAYATGGDDAALLKACNDAVTACEGNVDEPDTTTSPCTGQKTNADCGATIADVETCSTELIDAGAAALDSVPDCETLTKAYIDDMIENPAEPAEPAEPSEACKSVQTTCPVVLLLIGAPTTGGGDDGGLGGAGGE